MAAENNTKKALPMIHPLFYLCAMSAAVVYMYDASLSGYDLLGTGVTIDENFYQLSNHQLLKARRLKVEQRVLAVTAEAWPQCVKLEMTPVECKEFIDEEIHTFFTEEDRYIQTRIISQRNEADEWYNCVVIGMDDNDMVLGRNGDGLVYYDFDWIGSGEEATVEQQTEIPPITAMETPSGAAEGAEVTTIYKTTTTTTQAPEAPPEAADEQTVPAPTTDTPVTVTTTTVTTTTVLVELDPVEFDSAPIDVMGTAIVVEGSTVDDVVSGNATNPINGGVVLDPNAPSTPEGQEKLNEALANPDLAAIAPAGARTLEPFDCKDLNGFECCLLIKHTVRDADVSGRAMQCFLDYEESTCKKEWWREILETDRVMIYENENGKVSKTPFLERAIVSCNDKWGAEHDYNAEPCTPHLDFDVCIALDHSGSVCSPDNPKLCTNCPASSGWWDRNSACRDSGFNQADCCNNYANVKSFAQNVIAGLDDYNVNAQYSLVKFSTGGHVVGAYDTGSAAISAIGDMSFTGGYTNHQEAIEKCHSQLTAANPMRKKFIMLVTDGESTKPYSKSVAKDRAERAATRAQSEGSFIIPIFISNSGNNNDVIEFMKGLSGGKNNPEGFVYSVGNFDALTGLIDGMVNNIACSAS